METNDALLRDNKKILMNSIYDSRDGNQVDCHKTYSILYLESKHVVKLPEFFTKLHVKVTHSGFQIANKFSITERLSELTNKEIKGVSGLSRQ